MADLIDPKEVQIKDKDGNERTYVFSKPPYFTAREITSQWTTNALPKVGEYKVNEEMALKLFSYVEYVDPEGNHFRLSTKAMVENHVPDIITGGRIELGMIEYMLGFSVLGNLSSFLINTVKSSLAETSKTLTE